MASVFTALGVATASAVGGVGLVFRADGTSIAVGVGHALPPGVAVAGGTASAAAIPSSIPVTAVGTATAVGVPPLGAGSAAGTATVAAVSEFALSEISTATAELLATHGLALVSSAAATSNVSAQVALVSSLGGAAATFSALETRNAKAAAVGVAGVAGVAALEEVLEDGGDATADTAARIVAIVAEVADSSAEIPTVTVGVTASLGAASDELEGHGFRLETEASSGIASDVLSGFLYHVGAGAAAGIAGAASAAVATAAAAGAAAGAASIAGLRGGRQVEILDSAGDAIAIAPLPIPAVFPAFWSNTINTAPATWEDLPFNSMIEQDGVIYAASATGIARLNDVVDDNGSEVRGTVGWDLTDFRWSDYKKRSRSIYINGTSDRPFTVRVSNKQGEFDSRTHIDIKTRKPTNHRAVIGRGITSRHFRLSLLQDSLFSVADASMESGDTTRRT